MMKKEKKQLLEKRLERGIKREIWERYIFFKRYVYFKRDNNNTCTKHKKNTIYTLLFVLRFLREIVTIQR